jgi:hypothetical protein
MWPPPPPAQSQSEQPSYTPQGGQQDGYGYQQQSASGYPPPGYAQPGYQGQDQSQWGAIPGAPAGVPGQSRAAGEKGFLGSLFDFSFQSFVTPKIIKVLYVLFTIWTALVALGLLILGFRTGGIAGGLVMLIVVIPIYVLLTLGLWRVVLEAFMVIFRIYEETKKIGERTQSQV